MSPRPFFIIGSPRSGTTLLVRLINEHSNAYVPPETAFFHALSRFEQENGRRDQIDLNEFVEFYEEWRSVPFLNIPKQDFKKILLKNASNYCHLFLNLMNYISGCYGKDHWGEKTPHHLRHVEKIRKCIPDAKFVCIVRDGRAVSKSRIMHPVWSDNHVAASLKWRRDARIIQRLDQEFDDNTILLVKYEHLILNSASTIKSILEFIEEEYIEGGGHIDENKNRYNGYYQQPWMKKSTEAIDINRVNGWVSEYSPSDLRIVQFLIKDELEYFGYEQVKVKSSFWMLRITLEFLNYGYRMFARKLKRAVRNNNSKK